MVEAHVRFWEMATHCMICKMIYSTLHRFMPAYRRIHSAYNMFRMPSQALVDISQGRLTGYVLIAIRILPCNGAPALLEQAFDMRISMPSQCKTRLHVALVTHIYRQTKGIRK